MKRSKKLFLLIAALFFIMLIAIGFDISRKTTFPGSKKLWKESVIPEKADSVQSTTTKDSLKIEQEK